ncbi:MAG: hypothetical protein COB53_00700 [Elusimicrobia bacterium]|nr:MAG: hypothetical protein COB53_00700 [Elusimicrobiota bacterium]
MKFLTASLLLIASSVSAETGRAERRASYKQWDAGVALVLAGEEGLAKRAWAKCLRLNPENADCRAGLKLLGTKPDTSAKAPPPPNPADIKRAEAAAAKIPRGPQERAVKHWNAGIRFFQEGLYPQALAEWRLCKAHDKMNQDCQTGIDRVEGRLALPKQPKPAPKTRPKGPKEARSQRAFRHWNAGIRYYQKGELEKARKEWTLCRKNDPTNMDCHTGLLRIARQYGQE